MRESQASFLRKLCKHKPNGKEMYKHLKRMYKRANPAQKERFNAQMQLSYANEEQQRATLLKAIEQNKKKSGGILSKIFRRK